MKVTKAMNVKVCAVALALIASGCHDESDELIATSATGECAAGSVAVTIVSGDGQQAAAGSQLPMPLILQATCRDSGDNTSLVPDNTVSWTVASGGGTLSNATTPASNALVTWTLGPAVGPQTVEGRVNRPDSPVVTFTATATDPSVIDCNSGGGTDHTFQRDITTAVSWTKAGSPHYVQAGTSGVSVFNGGRLTIEPGAVVCTTFFVRDASFIAEGTAAEPILFSVKNNQLVPGFRLVLSSTHSGAPSSSSLKHVRVENGGLHAVPEHAVVVEDARFIVTNPAPSSLPICIKFVLQAGASTVLRRTVIDGFGGSGACSTGVVEIDADLSPAPLTFSARVLNTRAPAGSAALAITGNTVLTACEVSATTGGHGVAVVDRGVSAPRIVGCNLFGNAGSGVFDMRTGHLLPPIDARGNWWGDPAGPTGPNGDGVGGNIDASNPLPAPVNLGY